MGIPKPGKARKRRTGSARNIAEVEQTYHNVVSDLLSGGTPKGSEFYIKMKKRNADRLSDYKLIEDTKEGLRKSIYADMPWFDVDEEDQDSEILCPCGNVIPTSMKAFALRRRMADLRHIGLTEAFGSSICPKCYRKTVLRTEMMGAVLRMEPVGGFMGVVGIKNRLVTPLRYKGDVYGPDWMEGVTIPSMSLSIGDRPPNPIGDTTVGDVLRLVRGEAVYEDENDMEYKRYLPVRGGRRSYLVIVKRRWESDEVSPAVLESWMGKIDKRRLVLLSGTDSYNGTLRGLRFYCSGKYLSIGHVHYSSDFTWRDIIG
ncbi:MAG: hypothetical protein KAJ19_24535 [Gammaproteobacteria bacterium]|nr:hypothetical protein [Gammaproteobacteria bacterium]